MFAILLPITAALTDGTQRDLKIRKYLTLNVFSTSFVQKNDV